MFVSKKIGKVYFVTADFEKLEKLKSAEYYRTRNHCALVRAREKTNEENVPYEALVKSVTKAVSIKQVHPIFHAEDEEILKGVFFFDKKSYAEEKLEKLQKSKDAVLCEVDVYTNVPKSEQKKR